MGLFKKRITDDGRGADDAARIEHEDELEDPVPERPIEPREAELTPPEPEWDEPRVAALAAARETPIPAAAPEPPTETGTVEKDELRRAVSKGAPTGGTGAAPDADSVDRADQRVSAQDLIPPAPRRRHPLQPDGITESRDRRMTAYAFANQKGGVAKTTTALNLAVALAESGHDVLCIDLDPQGNLTMSQGIDPDEVTLSMYDVLVNRRPISEVVHQREIDIAVSSIDLAGAEIAMSAQIGRERALQKALVEVEDSYDFVCIDTPPSLGLLTINALTAADKVIVPVQCEYLSMRGLVQLQSTLEMIRENLNPDVEIEGILPTMLDARTVHAKEAVEILEENFGELVFKSRIRKTIKFAEAPVKGSSVLKYDPDSNAASYYRALAEEVLTHGQAT